MSDNSALVLTTAVGVDRFGRTYDSAIPPTLSVTTPTHGDTVVAAATAWLREQAACR